MEIEMPHAESKSVAGCDGAAVRELTAFELIDLQRARVLRLVLTRIVSACHDDREPIVGRNQNLVGEYAGVDGVRLLHFLAECPIAVDAVDRDATRIVVCRE
jgi:hypothetical protein